MSSPSVVNPLLGTSASAGIYPSATQSATVSSANSTGSSSSSTSLNSVDSLGTTFLSLLVQELQNQDPTQPMDSTEMVGQMISLNQLDQLASINQLLTNQFPGTTTTGATQSSASAQVAQTSIPTAVQAALLNQNASNSSNISPSSVSLPSF